MNHYAKAREASAHKINGTSYFHRMKWVLIFVGGGAGSVLRYLCSQGLAKFPSAFPWATFSVNVLGSFLIGALAAYYLKHSSEEALGRLLLITGFCGGFTTFSTFSLELLQYLQKQQVALALLYGLSSLLLCLLATALGFFILK
jgi:CrcB protein